MNEKNTVRKKELKTIESSLIHTYEADAEAEADADASTVWTCVKQVKHALTQEYQTFLISCFTLCIKIAFASHLLHDFCKVNMCCATRKIIFMKQEEKEKSEAQNGRR